MSLGIAPFAFPRPFRKRIRLSIWYLLAVQYAVTRGSFSRSALPSLAASRRAVGSLMRVYLWICQCCDLSLFQHGVSVL